MIACFSWTCLWTHQFVVNIVLDARELCLAFSTNMQIELFFCCWKTLKTVKCLAQVIFLFSQPSLVLPTYSWFILVDYRYVHIRDEPINRPIIGSFSIIGRLLKHNRTLADYCRVFIFLIKILENPRRLLFLAVWVRLYHNQWNLTFLAVGTRHSTIITDKNRCWY